MANIKLPIDAFEYYFSLGTERTYQAVADHYEVSKADNRIIKKEGIAVINVAILYRSVRGSSGFPRKPVITVTGILDSSCNLFSTF